MLFCIVHAYDFKIDGICYKITSQVNHEVAVTKDDVSSQKYSGKIVIPETITKDGIDYTVTSLDALSFSFATITSIELPSSLKEIGLYAFSDCKSLDAINIPEHVEVIGPAAFSRCEKLTSIHIPASVTQIGSNLAIQEYSCVDFCKKLKTITVDPNNTKYDSRNNCNAIIETATNKLINGCQSTIIPSDVVEIGKFAFYGHSSLSSIHIPASVSCISDDAFHFCNGLNSITVDAGNSVYDSRNGCNAIIETASNKLLFGCLSTVIPNTVEVLGTSAFRSLDISQINIPSSVKAIEEYCFGGCYYLADIVFSSPSSLVSIEEQAFYLCSNLKTLILPNSLQSISQRAFAYGQIRHLTIPNSVQIIEKEAFYDNKNIEDIHIECQTPPTLGEGVFSDEVYSATLYVPIGLKDTYKASPVWGKFAKIASIGEVEGLSLSVNENSLMIGETAQITATITPSDATDKSITWTSGDNNVATVSNTGLVTAVGAGNVTITATANGGTNISESCSFTVTKKVETYNPYLKSATTSMSKVQIGSSVTKVLGFYIKNEGTESITITKLNCINPDTEESLATTSDPTLLGTLGAGETKSLSLTIHKDVDPVYDWTYTYQNHEFVFRSEQTLFTPTLVESILIDRTGLSLECGDTYTLTTIVLPVTAEDQSLSWTSSNTSVATVDSDGMVTAIAPGSATITAKANDGSGVSVSCEVLVKATEVNVSGISISQNSASLTAGETLALTATVSPDDATDKSLSWSSSNTSVATVDSNGNVTAIAAGTASIKVIASGASSVFDTCYITVSEKTAITNVNVERKVDLNFNISGTLIDSETKGLVVKKTKDGKTKKVIIK